MRPNTEEALRYLGAGGGAPESLLQQTDEMAQLLSDRIQPRYTFQVYDLQRQADGIVLAGSGVCLTGRTAQRMLAQCEKAALLACTLGAQFDAMLRTEQVRDMARAVILDACGSALVEQGCDRAETALRARFADLYLTDRFSPGYGDLPLTAQPSICAALDAPRRLGVYVTESLLLNPAKSVTAVIGLSDKLQKARIRGCAFCSMRESCQLRKGGTTCAL